MQLDSCICVDRVGRVNLVSVSRSNYRQIMSHIVAILREAYSNIIPIKYIGELLLIELIEVKRHESIT